MRQIEGSSPDNLRQDLAEVCASFNGGIERLGKQNASVLEQTRVAGAMYGLFFVVAGIVVLLK
jgi:hypothetical protein